MSESLIWHQHPCASYLYAELPKNIGHLTLTEMENIPGTYFKLGYCVNRGGDFNTTGTQLLPGSIKDMEAAKAAVPVILKSAMLERRALMERRLAAFNEVIKKCEKNGIFEEEEKKMKVTGKPTNKAFLMKIRCQHVTDEYGFGYGHEVDFCGRELEIKESDVKKHPWFKYPNYHGVDYGVVCPVCQMFTVLKEESIPQYVKDAAKEISIQNGRYAGDVERSRDE